MLQEHRARPSIKDTSPSSLTSFALHDPWHKAPAGILDWHLVCWKPALSSSVTIWQHVVAVHVLASATALAAPPWRIKDSQ